MIVYFYGDDGRLIKSEEVEGDSVPAMATHIAPMEPQSGKVPVFNGVEWSEMDNVVIVPDRVTPRQFRLALLRAGLLDEINAMIDNSDEHKIYFEYSLEFERNHPLLISMANAMEISDEQIDSLFIIAGTL